MLNEKTNKQVVEQFAKGNPVKLKSCTVRGSLFVYFFNAEEDSMVKCAENAEVLTFLFFSFESF